MKLVYDFRVHDSSELIDALTLIKHRKWLYATWRDDEWKEPGNSKHIGEFIRNTLNDETDVMFRVFFNKETAIYKFKRKLNRFLKPRACGNIDCAFGDCPYFYENMDGDIEFIWRCILFDETEYNPKEKKEKEKE